MPDEFSFRDPHKRQTVTLKSIPIDRLEVVGHQRKPRPSHIEHLSSSIDRIGFIVPVVAIETTENGRARHIVIDGQHRLQAARELGIRRLPCSWCPIAWPRA